MPEPYYRRDNVTLYHGDCHDILPRLEIEVDTVITDPPYGDDWWDADHTRFVPGVDARFWDVGAERVGETLHAPLAGNEAPFDPTWLLGYRRVVIWGWNHFADRVPPGAALVWDKRLGEKKRFLADAEIAWMNHGRGVYIFSHGWRGMRRDSERGEYYHPTQKPAALYEWCLQMAKPEGVVIDPYAGAGWGAVACYRLGIPFVSIEIHEPYCERAATRVEGASRYDRRLIGLEGTQGEFPW